MTGLGFWAASALLEAKEAEHHLHNKERWFETAAVPSGEVHVADRVGSGSGAFVADAGNVTWGVWLQLLGSSDTPVDAGDLKYDPHRIMVSTVERANAPTFVQLGWGTSGAAALSDGDYSEFVFQTAAAVRSTPIDIIAKRIDVGTKLWIRVMVPGQDTGTVNLFFGVHFYDF